MKWSHAVRVLTVAVLCAPTTRALAQMAEHATINHTNDAGMAPVLGGSTFEAAVCAAPPACGPQWWIRGEYVAWAIGTSKLVEMGMDSLNSDLFNGLLAATGKDYKDFAQRLLGNDRTGYRVGAGGWLNDEQTLGVEADFMRLSRGPLEFSIGNNRDFNPLARIVPNGDIVLQRAGFLPETRAQVDRQTLAFLHQHRKDRDLRALRLLSRIGLPGIDANGREVVIPYGARDLANGSASFQLAQQTFWALDLLGKTRLFHEDGVTIDGLAGYRRVYYSDALSIQTDTVTLSRPLLPGTTLRSTDAIRTENTYDGALVGVDVGWTAGNWALSMRMTATLADYQADAERIGYKTITFPDGRRFAASGGTYLRSADLGTYSASGWTVISEVGFRATRTFGEHVALTLGGTFMYVPEAARAAGQLPLGIDPSRGLSGRGGSSQVRIQSTDLTAIFLSTMSAGLEFRY
jgi:Putative beta barrel porin-7 (BBP7)